MSYISKFSGMAIGRGPQVAGMQLGVQLRRKK